MSRTAPLFYHQNNSAIPLPHELCSPWPGKSYSESSGRQHLTKGEGYYENDITSLALIDIDDLETDTIYSNGSSDHDGELSPQETVARPLTMMRSLNQKQAIDINRKEESASIPYDQLSDFASHGRKLGDMKPHSQADQRKRCSRRSITSTNIMEEFSSYFSMISESDAEYDEQGLSAFDSESEVSSKEAQENEFPVDDSTNRQPPVLTREVNVLAMPLECDESKDYEDIEDGPKSLSSSVCSISSIKPLLLQEACDHMEENLSGRVEEDVIDAIHALYEDTEGQGDRLEKRHSRPMTRTPYVPGSLIDSWFSDPINEKEVTSDRHRHGKGSIGKMREKIKKVFSNFRQQPCAA